MYIYILAAYSFLRYLRLYCVVISTLQSSFVEPGVEELSQKKYVYIHNEHVHFNCYILLPYHYPNLAMVMVIVNSCYNICTIIKYTIANSTLLVT